MADISVSRKFLYDMSELYTKRKKHEITEEDFSIQRDALLEQEAKSQKTLGPMLITKELETIEADVANTVDQMFQVEEQEESERETRERAAKNAEKNRIEKEEKDKQATIEAENKRRIHDRDHFRLEITAYASDLESETNRWQRRFNWLQIALIIITTATASMAGVDGIPRGYVVIVGFTAASLGGILSYFQLQDKIYSSRKALADLHLECQMYDHCIEDYKNRYGDPEGAYLIFSKKITAIQAQQMLHEVELLKPKDNNQKAISDNKDNQTQEDGAKKERLDEGKEDQKNEQLE